MISILNLRRSKNKAYHNLFVFSSPISTLRFERSVSAEPFRQIRPGFTDCNQTPRDERNVEVVGSPRIEDCGAPPGTQEMNYWLDLFTGTTWREFKEAGSNVSGFRAKQVKSAKKMKSGDVFLCYLTGVMRWVGALEIIGPSTDRRQIWKEQDFPVRFNVKPMVLLEPEHGVPMEQLESRVKFYRGPEDRGKFRGFVRASLRQFEDPKDGELILSMLREAEKNPVSRPVDAKKLARKPLYRVAPKRGARKRVALVSVPEPEESPVTAASEQPESAESATTRHSEIQYMLLNLGAELGLDVWVARNDRGKKWNGVLLGSLPRMLDELPTQFNEATTRTIELIDVLWLSGNSIVAAFEVECTTSIYSGLLRMSDLLALQPSLDISLYLVAPDERRDKVEQELLRPTFSLREKPLAKICGYLPFTVLCEKLDGIKKLGLSRSLKANFLRTTAEFFGGGEGIRTE
ncbi:MAG TPA: hypothetical protein VEJ46_00950 [Candidatus Acidoferrum sp.]|nr:hypothetical protein [Candidatus Acidoferrum sp.]